MEKKFLQRFFTGLGSLLFLAALIVVILDPFYHYHGPIGNMKAVLQERDYQVAGTLDHFEYEAVILGTSVTENYNTDQFRELFGMQTVKAPRASGSNADLLWYLDRAYASHEVKRVFYFLDYLSLESGLTPTFDYFDTRAITNRNPFDDVQYLLNKDVLLKKIPLQFVYSYFLPYEEETPYSWYQTKEFGTAAVTGRYYPRDEFLPPAQNQERMELVEKNISRLEEMIQAHPDTEFTIVFSPVSILWWDDVYRVGELEEKLQEALWVLEAVSPYENVTVFTYQNDRDLVMNLEHYMDTVHFSYEVNRQICQRLANEEGQITLENYPEVFEQIREMVQAFSKEGILEYYPDATTE